jgi:hypothetical protein
MLLSAMQDARITIPDLKIRCYPGVPTPNVLMLYRPLVILSIRIVKDSPNSGGVFLIEKLK